MSKKWKRALFGGIGAIMIALVVTLGITGAFPDGMQAEKEEQKNVTKDEQEIGETKGQGQDLAIHNGCIGKGSASDDSCCGFLCGVLSRRCRFNHQTIADGYIHRIIGIILCSCDDDIIRTRIDGVGNSLTALLIGNIKACYGCPRNGECLYCVVIGVGLRSGIECDIGFHRPFGG